MCRSLSLYIYVYIYTDLSLSIYIYAYLPRWAPLEVNMKDDTEHENLKKENLATKSTYIQPIKPTLGGSKAPQIWPQSRDQNSR